VLDTKCRHELHIALVQMVIVCCYAASVVACDLARSAAEGIPYAGRPAVCICCSLHLPTSAQTFAAQLAWVQLRLSCQG
jgi:hypothetical protein